MFSIIFDRLKSKSEISIGWDLYMTDLPPKANGGYSGRKLAPNIMLMSTH